MSTKALVSLPVNVHMRTRESYENKLINSLKYYNSMLKQGSGGE